MNKLDYQEIFSEIVAESQDLADIGELVNYIPGLSDVDPDKLGIYLTTIDNEQYHYGDWDEKFSLQSISKVLSLTLVSKLIGAEVWQRVSVEPSGNAFNSLVQLEYEKGIPRNPLINAGAIVICDILVSHLQNPKQDFLNFVRGLSGNNNINYCQKTAESEKQVAFRNYALTYLMKDFDNIHNDIEEVLDFYFYLCSIQMTCKELCHTFLFLAANGTNPLTQKAIVSSEKAKRINAIMQLCGFYDEAGEFAFRVGLPGKSGVGGGIIAIHPGKYSIAVWSPRLNKKGNSYKGMKVLEAITGKTESSIF